MTIEIALVLGILLAALVLFVTEALRLDLVALLILCTLPLAGLVTPEQAVAGFSNPAVITVWAMFMLSEGLSRAGVADRVGDWTLRIAGRSEPGVIAVLMLSAGALSSVMNNVAVVTLLLPVAIDVARRSGVAATRILMPLSFGTLLGGLTTLIGTPPNLLISSALEAGGLPAFGFFDFAPIGVPLLLAGTAVVALLGRHLLPASDPARASDQPELRRQYSLQERIFALRVPAESLLVGRSIEEAGLTTVAGLLIIARLRAGRTTALPAPHTALQAGDILLAQGRMDRFAMLRRWSDLEIEREAPLLHQRLLDRAGLYELELAADSALAGTRLRHRDFREQYGANLLAIRRGDQVRRTRLADMMLEPGDRLLVQSIAEALPGLRRAPAFCSVSELATSDLHERYRIDKRLFVLRVPADSALAGASVAESRIGDAFDFRLLALFRAGVLHEWPTSDEVITGGDLLLLQGRQEDLDVLRGLQQLVLLEDAAPYLTVFDQGDLELVEAVPHPRAELAGRKLADLDLRRRYQVEVAALWRNGRPYRSSLAAMTLHAGDALLLVGPRRRLADLNHEPALIVLNPIAVPPRDARKAPLALGTMLLVIGATLFGLAPIHITAIAGAAVLLLGGCLGMEQAYRAIDWRTIFLIAGMLPLGTALQETGAGAWLADALVALVGPFGPWPAIAGLYGLTLLGTLAMPNAALVVLMAPIALSVSAALDVAPHASLMAIGIAAAASVTSPIAHPANLLVMGPGGYRTIDFLRLGTPLALLTGAVTAVLLPHIWPL